MTKIIYGLYSLLFLLCSPLLKAQQLENVQLEAQQEQFNHSIYLEFDCYRLTTVSSEYKELLKNLRELEVQIEALKAEETPPSKHLNSLLAEEDRLIEDALFFTTDNGHYLYAGLQVWLLQFKKKELASGDYYWGFEQIKMNTNCEAAKKVANIYVQTSYKIEEQAYQDKLILTLDLNRVPGKLKDAVVWEEKNIQLRYELSLVSTAEQPNQVELQAQLLSPAFNSQSFNEIKDGEALYYETNIKTIEYQAQKQFIFHTN